MLLSVSSTVVYLLNRKIDSRKDFFNMEESTVQLFCDDVNVTEYCVDKEFLKR